MSEHAYKPGDRVRLRKHPDVEGEFVSYTWGGRGAIVKFAFTGHVSGNAVLLDAIEPVPPPTFDPADLRVGDLLKCAGWKNITQVIERSYWMDRAITRVWRLDESGDYRLIFPPREV